MRKVCVFAGTAEGRRLVERTEGKRWLHHPRVETFLAERVALFQRVYRR